MLSLAEDSKSVMIASPSDWKERVTDKIKEYSMGCNADFILTDKNGGVLISSNYDGTYADVEIPQAMLDSFGSEASYVYGDFDGSFKEQCHIVGISFEANGPSYYLLAVSTKSNQDYYIWNIMEIFGISTVIVIIIVLIIVYFTTMKLTEPVKEIAAVSKEIGKGNFSVALPTYNVQEFEELSNAFNDMAASLKNYDTMRNSFVANVSHELRTPMTSIGGLCRRTA